MKKEEILSQVIINSLVTVVSLLFPIPSFYFPSASFIESVCQFLWYVTPFEEVFFWSRSKSTTTWFILVFLLPFPPLSLLEKESRECYSSATEKVDWNSPTKGCEVIFNHLTLCWSLFFFWFFYSLALSLQVNRLRHMLHRNNSLDLCNAK